ncbi:MAG: hypothetical protein WCK86_22365, partial [Planctomycetia bacterium]
MPHISGEKDAWTDNWTATRGEELFWDLIRLFYDIQAPAPDSTTNVLTKYDTETVVGSASYRFDDLPARTVDKILPENYDISRVAGVLRISGGPDSVSGDQVIINARNAGGITAAVENQTLSLADYYYNQSAILSLDSRLTHDDVQGALVRANKETQIGILEQLRTGQVSSAVVALTVDATVQANTPLGMSGYLTSLMNAANSLVVNSTTQQIQFQQDLQGFVTRGQSLIGATVATSTSQFSVDALDEFLNSVVLQRMKADGSTSAVTVETELKNLRNYLTLIGVSNGLKTEGYTWVSDPGLRVYEQVTPNIAARVTTFKYNQKIWDTTEYAAGNQWLTADRTAKTDLTNSSSYTFPVNDTAGTERTLREITYVIYKDGNTSNLASGNLINGSISGAAYGYDSILMQRAYAAKMDNYQTSYYSYSFYGVGADGSQILEAVALRRLNDRDQTISPMVAVDARSTLGPTEALAQDRVYLTSQNWTAYLDALVNLGKLTSGQRTTFAALNFSDSSVTQLITTAFGQTLRSDISLPIKDGLTMTKTGSGLSYSVNVDQVQDDSGLYLPKLVTINTEDTIQVTVPSSYVSSYDAASVRTVQFDVVTGLNARGLWFSGFENVTLNTNASSTGNRVDTITVNQTRYIDNLTINTGDGADLVSVLSSAQNLVTVNTGEGADSVQIASTASGAITVQAGDGNDIVMVLQSSGTSTVEGGTGDDSIYVNYTISGSTRTPGQTNQIAGNLTLKGQVGSDRYYIAMMGNGSAQIRIDDPVNPAGTDLDLLEIHGSNSRDMFLFRPSSISSVAVDVDGRQIAGGGATHLGYTSGFGTITVHGHDGADTFVLDDTGGTLDIFGEAGNDTFQIGQVFKSSRDAFAGISNAEDYFETTETTLGSLSNGISYPASLYGGGGDDTFTVYRNIAEVSLYGEADNDNFL